LTLDGIIHAQILEGSYDSDQFCGFLHKLVAEMNLYPVPKSILVMDNCAIHHVDEVEEVTQAAYVCQSPMCSGSHKLLAMDMQWYQIDIPSALFSRLQSD
jgi:hypothetical protein